MHFIESEGIVKFVMVFHDDLFIFFSFLISFHSFFFRILLSFSHLIV